jgi:ribosome-associated protein
VSELVTDVCKIAYEKGGNEIVVMEIARLLPIATHFVLITCENPIHIRAMADELEERLETEWGIRVTREGEPESRWVILDCGDIIIHLFDAELRRYYDLEGLWADAPMLRWEGKLVAVGRLTQRR